MKIRAAKMQFLPVVGIAFLLFKADATSYQNIFPVLFLWIFLKRSCGLFSTVMKLLFF